MRKELELPGSLSVFNMHVNNAGQRALHVCRACFSAENADLRSLERMYKDGIMEIYTHRPNPVTRLFEHACFIFANGLDRDEVSPEPSAIYRRTRERVCEKCGKPIYYDNGAATFNCLCGTNTCVWREFCQEQQA